MRGDCGGERMHRERQESKLKEALCTSMFGQMETVTGESAVERT